MSYVRAVKFLKIIFAVLVFLNFSCQDKNLSPVAEKPITKEVQPKDLKAFEATPKAQYKAKFFDGRDFDSHDYKGRKLIFAFFSYTHRDAKDMLKSLMKLKEYERDYNFRIFAVGINNGKNTEVQKFFKDNQIDLPLIFDDVNLSLATQLNIASEVTFVGVNQNHEPAFGVKQYVFNKNPDDEKTFLAYLKQALSIQEYHSTQPRYGIYPKAPDFSAKTLDGKTIKLSQYRGKAVLVLFFSPRCPHCQHEMTFLRDKLYPEYKAKGFEVLALSVLEMSPENKKIYDDFKFTWPVVDDHKREIRNLYSDAAGVPENFWIDKDGRIKYTSNGFGDQKQNTYVMQLKALLGLPNPPLLSDKNYSGVDTCKICHEPQYVSWSVTPHAHAWQTLQIKGEDFNPECVGCHSVGFDKPGGFHAITNNKTGEKVVQVTPGLENVQCENCHGLGGPHVQEVDMLAREKLKQTCLECHTDKFSLHFDFDERIQKVNHSTAKDVMNLSEPERLELVKKVSKKPEDLFDTSVKNVGSDTCVSCHQATHANWQKSLHKDVSCESCHGPGGKHAESKRKEDIRTLGDDCPFCVIEQICMSCHDSQKSPDFNIHIGLEKIKGHH